MGFFLITHPPVALCDWKWKSEYHPARVYEHKHLLKCQYAVKPWAELHFGERSGKVWTVQFSLQNSQWLVPRLEENPSHHLKAPIPILVSPHHPESKEATPVSPAGASA